MKTRSINHLMLLCALVFMSGTLPAQNADNNIEAEIPYAGGVPLVPNVRPVIVLQESDYEMGFQHAQQIIQIFGKYYLEGAAAFERSKKAKFLRLPVPKILA